MGNRGMMKFKSFFEFKLDYDKHGFVDKVCRRYYPAKSLNHKQVHRYYLQYVRKWDKAYGGNILAEAKEMSDDAKLSALVRERDVGCRLVKVMATGEYMDWLVFHNGIGSVLDAAHVFGKGAFPWMRFDEKNVVVLNRFSHSCLDNGKSPIDGKMITDDERKIWWKRIVGEKDWEYLFARSRERN